MWTALVILLLAPARINYANQTITLCPWWWVVFEQWLKSRKEEQKAS